MENNKQSSVDYLHSKILLRIGLEDSDIIELRYIIEQAKAMHKQELLNIFNCGRNFQATGEGTFNEIYNEIYGS